MPEELKSKNVENNEKANLKNNKQGGNYKSLAVVIAAFLCMAAGAAGTYFKYKSSIEFGEKYPLVIETYDFMKDAPCGIPDNVDESVQINGFLSLYDDKYTYYKNTDVNSREFVIESVNSSPTALGCGFEIDFDDKDRLFFSAVYADMPAYTQGFRTGDQILSINDEDVDEYSDASELKGKKDTVAQITILRNDKQQQIELLRKNNVNAAFDLDYECFDNILYVKYGSIGTVSASALKDIVGNQEYESIVIDMRNNGGGEIGVAVSAADLFVDKAEVRLESLSGDSSSYSTNDGIEINAPIIIIMNEKTASSAEIFTALLKQYANATLVGETSFGKGIYQSYGMFHGGTLRYTNGKVYVGDWECWQGIGIQPDIEVEMDSSLIGTDEDIQLQKALELLS